MTGAIINLTCGTRVDRRGQAFCLLRRGKWVAERLDCKGGGAGYSPAAIGSPDKRERSAFFTET